MKGTHPAVDVLQSTHKGQHAGLWPGTSLYVPFKGAPHSYRQGDPGPYRTWLANLGVRTPRVHSPDSVAIGSSVL